MRHFKQLTLSTLFALSTVLLLAGCGELGGGKRAPGEGEPNCATQKDCNDPNLKCLSLNEHTEKGYCQATCTGPSDTSCGDGYKCVTAKDKGNVTGIACFKKCANDKECGSGSICDTAGVCIVKKCTGASDTSCGNGRECNDSTKACQGKAPATQGPSNPQPKGCTNEHVATDCGRGPIWNCNTGTDTSAGARGTCELRPLVSVIIQDLSQTGDKACLSSDKGADILGVALESTSGDIVAWGRNAGGAIVKDSGDAATGTYNNSTGPNGQPLSVKDINQCQSKELSGSGIEFSSTGCGGYMKIVFDGSSNSAHTLEKGKVRVYEFNGNACYKGNTPPNYPDDKYAVWGCTSSNFDTIYTYTDIQTFITGNCVKLSGNQELNGNYSLAYPPTP